MSDRRLDRRAIIGGAAALAAGVEQTLWVDILCAHAAELPELDTIFENGATMMQPLADGRQTAH